mgnify:CR=1 FL=1
MTKMELLMSDKAYLIGVILAASGISPVTYSSILPWNVASIPPYIIDASFKTFPKVYSAANPRHIDVIYTIRYAFNE